MGRKPKPAAVKKLEGNLGKRKLKLKTEVLALVSSIIMPFRAKSQSEIDISLEIMYTLSKMGNSSFKGDVGFYEI